MNDLHRENDHPTQRVLIGLGVIAIGTLALLDRQHLFDLPLLHTFWPLALVLLGLARLTARSQAPIAGLAMILIGSLMTAHNLGYSGFSMRDWWPAFVILGGVSLLVARPVPEDGFVELRSAARLAIRRSNPAIRRKAARAATHPGSTCGS